jgi:hypothetical protein
MEIMVNVLHDYIVLKSLMKDSSEWYSFVNCSQFVSFTKKLVWGVFY